MVVQAEQILMKLYFRPNGFWQLERFQSGKIPFGEQ